MKKLLIVQFRTDQSLAHEQQCFREELVSEPVELYFMSAVAQEFPTELSAYDAVILGGSGEFMLGEGAGIDTWRGPTFEFIDQLLEKNIPTLGICFGYQLIALQQGAHIVNDEAMRETGTFDIFVNEQGKQDPVFAAVPAVYAGQFAHKETIVNTPAHLTTLASTERVAVNAFRVQDKLMWGTLSHPELNRQRLIERLKLFPLYQNGKQFDEVIQEFRESAENSLLLYNFVNIIKD